MTMPPMFLRIFCLCCGLFTALCYRRPRLPARPPTLIINLANYSSQLKEKIYTRSPLTVFLFIGIYVQSFCNHGFTM